MQNQEERLEEIFKNNNNKGMAIAITGSWGVGKTFFWNNFIESRVKEEKNTRNTYHYKLASLSDHKAIFNKKYAYVSLFGVESLGDLKTQIYTQLSGHHFSAKDQPKFEVPRWMKAIASGLKDEKFSQWGFSASMRFFDAMLFTQIKDAIICFDDFERMSNKLDIKDVMGLANQLKLEKNCQVILILDETKTEGENKNKYAEYKEKLIDEVIKITSVEPLLRDRAKEANIDDALIELMVKFANELDIHNFRFFQKVIKLYKKFRDQLPKEVAFSTKETILIRVLQGYFIENYGSLIHLQWDDFNISYAVARRIRKEDKQEKDQILEKLEKINFKLVNASDAWAQEFQKEFDQKGQTDFCLLCELANSHLISDKNNAIKNEFYELVQIFWSLNIDESYPAKLYEITKKVIGLDSLNNISFAINLLEVIQPNMDIQELERLTLAWIAQKMSEDRNAFYRAENRGEIRKIFKNCIENFKKTSDYLPNLIDAVFNIYIQGAWNSEDELALEKATKQQWGELLFSEICQDERFYEINGSYLVEKILNNTEFKILFRQIIIEIYQEKGKESEFYKNYMNYLISRLDN